jgi:radical SAM protein with 4Fe4S-binding SPASM domain
MSEEQWMENGECKKCRRRKYCTKLCTASKRKLRSDVFEVMDATTGGFLSHVINKAFERQI